MVDEVPADLLEIKFKIAVPVLTDMATDFKPELAAEGLKTLKKFVKVLDNLDLQNKYDLIVETLADPKKGARMYQELLFRHFRGRSYRACFVAYGANFGQVLEDVFVLKRPA